MTPETEKILADVKSVKNITDKRGKLTTRQTRYLTYNERENRQTELNRIEGQLKQPEWVNAGLSAEGRANLSRRRRGLQDELEGASAPKLDGDARDALDKRRAELEDEIKVGMPTQVQMRRNPVGAVDQHRKWNTRNTEKILEWKNIQRALNPESDDKDLSNIERLRATGNAEHGATFIADAQIPGKFGFTSVPQENWDATFGAPKVNSPLKQAARRETSAKQRAALARARASKAAKRASIPVSVPGNEAESLTE